MTTGISRQTPWNNGQDAMGDCEIQGNVFVGLGNRKAKKMEISILQDLEVTTDWWIYQALVAYCVGSTGVLECS